MNKLTNDEKVNILSFNYTNPFIEFKNDSMNMIKSIINVHGSCNEDNIIFGIDYTNELPTNAHIFTKTYRKMFQSKPTKILDLSIETIKFYGHSLGVADYSYFQSIFDYCYIYDYMEANGTTVNLQFYFSVYDESKREEITRNVTDSVYKLITTYGENFDSVAKAKGKKLLHKLLLEGRIHIEFLPNI